MPRRSIAQRAARRFLAGLVLLAAGVIAIGVVAAVERAAP